MREDLIQKIDLTNHIEALQKYFAREKEIYIEGDYNLHHSYIKELLETNYKEPPKVKNLDSAIMHINKKGLLKLDDIFQFVKIIGYFEDLKTIELKEKLSSWVHGINTPMEIIEIVDLFTEKGAIKPEKDERLYRLEQALKSEREALRQKIFNLASSKKLAEYLIDRQVHFINGEEALLLRGGFSSALKGNVIDRSSAGFFYVVPDEVSSLKEKIEGIFTKKEEIIYEYEKSISSTFNKFVKFIKWINKEFDRFDHYQARVDFANANRYDFALQEEGNAVILDKFHHPALKDGKPFSVNFDKKVFMITGVNAGGKTMLLKSILSAVFMAKHLIPFKFNPKKTKIGKFKNIEAIIEDPQSSKNDISTFAGRMQGFSKILNENSLILGVDEIELGTDSDEAASLFKVILEELMRRGTKVVITTHHKRLAAMMAGNEDVELVAALYDEERQIPLFSFLEGSIGQSYAFETASRYGIPHAVVKRAKEVYGEDKERLNDLIQRSSELELKLNRKLKGIEEKEEEIERTRAAIERERSGFKEEMNQKRLKLEKSYQDAINIAKLAAKQGKKEDIHRKLNEAHKKREDIGDVNVKEKKEFKKGDTVKYLTSTAVILSLKGKDALLDMDGKKVHAPLSRLVPATKLPKKKAKTNVNVQRPNKLTVKLDLHGMRGEEAIDKLDKFVSDALIVGYDELLIYHGIGSGILSRLVKEYLGEHPHIKSFTDAHPSQGGFGATVATI